VNEDNLSNVRGEASRYFRNKEREYLKNKINEFLSNNNNKNIRDMYSGINVFEKGYQPRTNLVEDEKGDFVMTRTAKDWEGVLGRRIPFGLSLPIQVVKVKHKSQQ
jgi:hypothetical protein